MRIVSVNVGRPQEIRPGGQLVRTSIFKAPVDGRVRVRTLNIDGDEQSDLTVHGGPDKAVYLYPSEHYAYWQAQLPDLSFPWGAFGENLTIEGLLEDEVCVGDHLRIGTAEFVVTQPRMPCYKLSVRFDRKDMVKRFYRSGRNGFYVSVFQEGDIGVGDVVELHPAAGERLSIASVVNELKRAQGTL
jgi:MOSC domain-containing protein YiiM